MLKPCSILGSGAILTKHGFKFSDRPRFVVIPGPLFQTMAYEINHITFKQIYNEHFKALVYFAIKKGVMQETAEDFVSDKFMKLWELKSGFDDPDKIKAFLYVSVYNAIKNFQKTRRIVLVEYVEEIEDEIYCNEIETSVLQTIMDEINSLPPMCCTIFKKRVFNGESYQQIMDELNIAYRTVDSHYQRARMILKTKIKFPV